MRSNFPVTDSAPVKRPRFLRQGLGYHNKIKAKGLRLGCSSAEEVKQVYSRRLPPSDGERHT